MNHSDELVYIADGKADVPTYHFNAPTIRHGDYPKTLCGKFRKWTQTAAGEVFSLQQKHAAAFAKVCDECSQVRRTGEV